MTSTLCVDVGGTSVKAVVLDEVLEATSEWIQVPTPYPLTPGALVKLVGEETRSLGSYQRATVGFPGMVRAGRVLTAPYFITTGGPGSDADDALTFAWTDTPLQASLETALGCPVILANDADVHGAGVVQGQGLELVVTLGTGFGTALYECGDLCPHLELAHHPLADGATYNEYLGDTARRAVGNTEWSGRVGHALFVLASLTHYDRAWVGGGNARHLEGPLPERSALVTDRAGMLGGVRIWSQSDPAG